MKVKWLGITAVIFIAATLIALKPRAAAPGPADTEAGPPQVVIVADLSEAGTSDGCGKMIDAVRAAHARGVRTLELPPESTSALLAQYHVLVSPTVLFLSANGEVSARYEGEARQVVAAVQHRLQDISLVK